MGCCADVVDDRRPALTFEHLSETELVCLGCLMMLVATFVRNTGHFPSRTDRAKIVEFWYQPVGTLSEDQQEKVDMLLKLFIGSETILTGIKRSIKMWSKTVSISTTKWKDWCEKKIKWTDNKQLQERFDEWKYEEKDVMLVLDYEEQSSTLTCGIIAFALINGQYFVKEAHLEEKFTVIREKIETGIFHDMLDGFCSVVVGKHTLQEQQDERESKLAVILGDQAPLKTFIGMNFAGMLEVEGHL